MIFHDDKFFISEFAILVQNQIRDSDFTDIVKRSCAFELVDVSIGENTLEFAFDAELDCNGFDIFRRFLDVVAGALVASFDHFCKFHNDDFLHALDALALRLHFPHKVVRIARHGAHVFV